MIKIIYTLLGCHFMRDYQIVITVTKNIEFERLLRPKDS